jgi:hypothetical protein
MMHTTEPPNNNKIPGNMYFVLLHYCEQPSNVRSLANTGATSSGLQEASSRTSRSSTTGGNLVQNVGTE